jgi:hypothetical protein
MALTLWGDGSKWGDGDKWNASVMQLKEYFAIVDRASNNHANYTTDWCLQSPDGTYWIPSITEEP